MSSIFQRMFQAQAAFQDVLLAKPNVVGVAVGYKESGGVITDEPAVVVLVQQKKPLAALSAEAMIPSDIGGVRTDVYEVGYLQAHQPNPKDRFRPVIPAGVSIGHYKVTAGTLAAVVRDRTTGERFILSNNHVLANSNEALVGDAILQPAAIDGGKDPGDVVARLERFIPLSYLEGPLEAPKSPDSTPTSPSGCDIADVLVSLSNLLAGLSGSSKRLQAVSTPVSSPQTHTSLENIADCALARPLQLDMFSDQTLNIGVVKGTKPSSLGMRIRKSGRTTGYTESTVTLLNATVNVAYDTSQGPRTARFVGQVICEPMSQGGDSGSLIVDVAENAAVGLLFAGSPLATIFTPIETVLTALNITLEL
jgi:hypothetical protein